MKKIFFLIWNISLGISVNAQFSNSDQVYCYEYAYTMEDGIKSQTNNNGVIFVSFQNNTMGFVYATKTDVASRSVSYYENEARNKLAQNYRKWNSTPANIYDIANLYIYDSSNSSSSKYTYRRQTKSAGANYSPYGTNVYWMQPSWNGDCYTFSTDKNDFCIWYVAPTQDRFNFGPRNFNERKYYKRIDANSLKPNVDDLW